MSRRNKQFNINRFKSCNNERHSCMLHNTLFEGSGKRHSNEGLQLTHDMFIAGYFMLLFDLTPDRAASDGHIALPDQGNIKLELRFHKPLPVAFSCLPYREYDSSVRIDQLRCVDRLLTGNGRGADSIHFEGRDFVPGRLSVRHSSAAFCNSSGDSYRKFGSAHV